MIDVLTIRKDFPIFQNFENEYGKPLVYLDSASSSLTPEPVLIAMNRYYREYRSNIHRSSFVLSEKATLVYEEARARVASAIGAIPEQLFFTSGATAAARTTIDMCANFLDIQKGESVLVCVSEHHSILLPLLDMAKERGADIVYVEIHKDGSPDIESYKEGLKKNPRIVCMTHANNITGYVTDVKHYSEMAHEVGAIYICDGSQTALHMPVDVSTLGVDIYFFSAHKMCGPTGVSAVYMSETIAAHAVPVTSGGGAVASVGRDAYTLREGIERFEAGTPNIAGVIGFAAACEYIQGINERNIHNHVQELVRYALERLAHVPSLELHCAPCEHNAGILSFSIDGVHSHDVAHMLGEAGIAVRSGYHCAEPLVQAISSVTLTRLSFYMYTSKEDIDRCIETILHIQKTWALRAA